MWALRFVLKVLRQLTRLRMTPYGSCPVHRDTENHVKHYFQLQGLDEQSNRIRFLIAIYLAPITRERTGPQ